MHVPLYDILLPGLAVDTFEIPGQINSPSLAGSHRLDNESLGLLFIELALQVTRVSWQNPRFGEEIVFIWEKFLHSFQVSAQIMLVGQCRHPRIVVNPLVTLHFLESSRLNCRIRPIEIPVDSLVLI